MDRRAFLRHLMVTSSASALVLLAACDGGTSGLAGPTWRWTTLTENAPLVRSDVADPSRYTLTLREDGSFQAVADCNTVNGTFETSDDEITLSMGASTLAACPEGSRSDEYINLLRSVSSYNVDGDHLSLYLSNAAGRLAFTAD
ncbi:MAG TPA: META domain-containing protein [Actinomycetota bacterium]|nr:META domain-containing protein [Actinomycetota bacterium]